MDKAAYVTGLGFPFVAGCAADARVRARIIGSLWRFARSSHASLGTPFVWERGDSFVALPTIPGIEIVGNARTADSLVVQVGVRLTWDEDEARVAAADDLHAALDGRWISVRADRRRIQVVTDPHGAAAAFTARSDDAIVVSNLPGLFADATFDLPFEPAAAASAIALGTALSGAPWFEGVRRLWAASELSMTAHRCEGRTDWTPGLQRPYADETYDPGRALHRLSSATIALYGAASGREVFLPLSGGRDSRLVLAGALHAGLRPETFTVVDGLEGENRAASALAAAVGLAHRRIEPARLLGREADPLTTSQHVSRAFAGTASSADAHFAQGQAGALGNSAWLTGHAGEVARGFYGPALGPATRHVVRLRAMSRRPGRQPLLTCAAQRTVTREVDRRISRVRQTTSNATLGDAFYVADRLQRHFGGSLAMFEPLNPPLMPLWTHGVMAQAWALSPTDRLRQRMHRDLVARGAPELSDIPLADRSRWDDDARATGVLPQPRGAGLRLGPAQLNALLKARNSLESELERHPTGALLWRWVDRSAASKLLERPAEALDAVERQYLWRLLDAAPAFRARR